MLIAQPGPHIQGLDIHVQRAGFFSNLRSEITLCGHVAQPNPALDDRRLVVTTGKCDGGASGVNLMMYTRASASNCDDWERLGNPGWCASQLIYLAKKLESYTPFKDETHSHGTSGLSKRLCYDHRSRFLSMAIKYDGDRRLKTPMTSGPATRTGDGQSKITIPPCPLPIFSRYVDHRTGACSDAAHAYIYDKAHLDNLVILTGKHVNRIAFENRVATGVECVDEQGPHAEVVLFEASKLVILSSGTFGSPRILERSGTGSKEILDSYGIPST